MERRKLLTTQSKSLTTLEYSKVINDLSQFAVSTLAQGKILKFKPQTKPSRIQELQDETEDGRKIIRLKASFPLGRFEDITPHLKRLQIHAALNGKEIAEIGRVLKNVREIQSFMEELKEEEVRLKRLYSVVESFRSLAKIEKAIFQVVDEGGFVVSDASQKLREIRTGISRTEGQIRDKLDQVVRGSQAKYLTDAIITMRNDRYVIPVKAENRGRFGGVVHDQSSTGQTVFVEPQFVVDLNNRLKQYQSEEKAEVDKLLQDLSEQLAPEKDTIEHNLHILVVLDIAKAKAEYALSLNASRPKISHENHLALFEARHPLIAKEEVVANDIVIGQDYKTIVVTGPNTGGKTIVLKTLGLLQLMGQTGLQIPVAENSTIGVFESIFADIGDEQSIEQSLSTFSSHMTNIIDILNGMTSQSLILLDELGAGTDPQEGAALAISMLDYIASVGAMVVITSHYPELKAYAYNRLETINASMEFDVDTLSPTYRLLIGIPGKSNAFEIAQRLGLSNEVIGQAKQLMSGESQNIDEMIQDLSAQRKQAEADAITWQQELNKAQKLRREIEQFYEEFNDERDKAREKAKVQANQIVEDAKIQADRIIKDLRAKQLNANTEKNVKEHEFIDAKSQLNELTHEEKQLKNNKVLQKAKKNQALAIGDEVNVESFGQKGTLVEKTADREWMVQMGMMKMKIKEDQLSLSKKDQKPQRSTLQSSTKSSIKSSIDLRGERVEQAVHRLDQYIDQALLANLGQVTVIHGMGTGAVRQGVKDYLKKHRSVESYQDAPANQGGNGATIVIFK